MKLDTSKGTLIQVRNQERDEDPEVAPYYEGIYELTLNQSTAIKFIPAFARTPENWPPTLPGNIDDVQDSEEARRWSAALSDYAVTPDPVRAGGQETFSATTTMDGQPRPTVVFYVTPAQFQAFCEELAQVEEKTWSVYDYCPLSEVRSMAWANWILERFPEFK